MSDREILKKIIQAFHIGNKYILSGTLNSFRNTSHIWDVITTNQALLETIGIMSGVGNLYDDRWISFSGREISFSGREVGEELEVFDYYWQYSDLAVKSYKLHSDLEYLDYYTDWIPFATKRNKSGEYDIYGERDAILDDLLRATGIPDFELSEQTNSYIRSINNKVTSLCHT